MNKASYYLTKTGNRLSILSKHYSSGHSSLMRIQRSFRGEKAQREALINMFKKSAAYGKSAARSNVAGGVLKWSASRLMKGALKPFSFLDVLTPSTAHAPTFQDGEKARIEIFVLIELKKYCDKYNNYNMIINQQYFIQG